MKKPVVKQASKSRKNRKYHRNYIGRDKSKGSKYVARAQRRGTFRMRKGIQNR